MLFWAQSAGTSGPQKLFPLTATFQKQFQRSALHAQSKPQYLIQTRPSVA